MTPPNAMNVAPCDAALAETIDTVLDSQAGLIAVVGDEMTHDELEALVRELAVELLDVYWTLFGEGSP
ncbi:MAG: hypothetical protein AAF657_30200 [Acidobacteriota bacterium]